MADEKEIDIYDIIRFIVQSVTSNKVIVLLIFTISLAFFIFKHFNSDYVYHNSVTIACNSYPYILVKKLHNPIEVGIKNKMYDSLSQWLNIPDSTAKKILSISIYDLKSPPVIDVNTSTIQLVYSSNDKNALIGLGNHVLDFFNKNEFVLKNNEIRKDNLNEYLTNTKSQISRLDSIQGLIAKNLSENNSNSKIEDYNLGSVYLQMSELKKEEIKTQMTLEWIDEFKLVSELINKEKNTLIKDIILGILTGLVLTLFLILTMGAKKMVKKAMN